jgi:hypothetical protein
MGIITLPVSIPCAMVTGMPWGSPVGFHTVSNATAYVNKHKQDGNNFYYPVFHKLR